MKTLKDLIGNWIKIVDSKNDITIESYDYSTGIIEGTTKNHCVRCVAANQCWFRNEEGKKPEKFNFSLSDFVSKGLLPGLYHPNCHCEEITIYPSIDDIDLIIPSGKIGWLFFDKLEWINSMGYCADNKFLEILTGKIKESYFYGNYFIQNHTNYGIKIKINFDLNGGGIKQSRVYKLTSSFTIFPNGKIKCNTLIGGWQK